MFPVEPKKSGDPFETLQLANEDNMILTPHIGGSTFGSSGIHPAISSLSVLRDYWFKGSTLLVRGTTADQPRWSARVVPYRPSATSLPGVLAHVNHACSARENINVSSRWQPKANLCKGGHRRAQKPSAATLEALAQHRKAPSAYGHQLTQLISIDVERTSSSTGLFKCWLHGLARYHGLQNHSHITVQHSYYYSRKPSMALWKSLSRPRKSSGTQSRIEGTPPHPSHATVSGMAFAHFIRG